MKTKILLLITIAITAVSFSQQTFVPDDAFEARLQQLGLDSGPLDNFVLTANINTLESFSYGNFTITDITGLQDFVSLKDLSVKEVDDISPIEGLALLETLSIGEVTDTTINLEELTNLKELYISESSFISLDLSSNNKIEELSIDTTPVTQVIFSDNTIMDDLTISFTEIINIDVSTLTGLTSVNFSGNDFLQSIDISQSTNLDFFKANDNAVLSSLDLSNNTALTYVEAEDNLKLVSVNIKNGNNTAMGQSFRVKDNPLLDCIQVDDVAWSMTNWGFTSGYFVGYSTDCSVTNNLTRIPDSNFEQRLVTLGYDEVVNGMVHTPNIISVTNLTVSNINITDLTGIEDFTSLETLKVFDNALTTLDVSNNLELKDLRCFNNQITVLDVSGNTKLKDLRAFDNNIETLDLSNNGLLESIKVYNNALTSLNVKNDNNSIIATFETTGNPNLVCIDVDDLNYANNNWTDIDSQTNFSLDCSSTGGDTVSIPDAYFEDYLESLGAGNGIPFDGLVDATAVAALSTVDLNNLGTVENISGIEFFTSLTYLNISGNNISSVDVSSNTLLFYLDVSNNNLTSIDVSNNTKLGNLTLSNNNLTSLDVTNLLDLEILRINNNQITQLNITKNVALMELNCNSNALVELNLLSNTNLEQLYCEQNALEYLDLSQNELLSTFSCGNNALIGLNIKNGNNTLLTNANFSAIDNPNLTCIQVDDKNYSDTTWAQIDMNASFNENCTPVNDDCSYTIPIVLGQDTPGSTTSASAGANNPNCAQSGIVLFDVWYEVEAPASGSIVLNLSAQPLTAKIAIYNSCADTQPFACDEDTLSVNNLTPGQKYYLQIWLETSGSGRSSMNNSGAFTLTAQDSSVLSVDSFIEESSMITVYPNPAKTEVFIAHLENKAIEKVEIYNLLGKRKVVVKSNKLKEKIDVSTLSSGIYILKTFIENKTVSKKLIIN